MRYVTTKPPWLFLNSCGESSCGRVRGAVSIEAWYLSVHPRISANTLGTVERHMSRGHESGGANHIEEARPLGYVPPICSSHSGRRVSRVVSVAASLAFLLVWNGCLLSFPHVSGDANVEDGKASDAAPDGAVDVVSHECGNGLLEPGELCDEGKLNSDTVPDSCRTNCTPADCGDGVLDSDEVCDGSDFGGQTCQSHGFSGGQLLCDDGCSSIATDNCTTCGNGLCEVLLGEDQQGCSEDCGWRDVCVGGSHICAVTRDGTLWCWGKATDGQLGLGQVASPVRYPTPVAWFQTHDLKVQTVACGYFHTCAIAQDGQVYCWGNNLHGAVGSGAGLDYQFVPVPVLGLPSAEPVASISLGHDFSCALVVGRVWCWGHNQLAQLGTGDQDQDAHVMPIEADLPDATQVVFLSAGESHVCVVLQSGEVWCWGVPEKGATGNSQDWGQWGPHEVSFLPETAARLGGGRLFSCVSGSRSRQMWCWGNASEGVLGDGNSHSESGCSDCSFQPVQPRELGPVASFAVGRLHACAIDDASHVKCWGQNTYGAAGVLDTTAPVTLPTVVTAGGEQPTKLALGFENSCVIDAGFRLWCWGSNRFGQLGDGSTEHLTCTDDQGAIDCSATPVEVVP